MATLKDFLPYVQDGVASAGAPLCRRHLRSALRQFLEQSHVWRLDLDPIDVEDYRTASSPKDEGEYDLLGAVPSEWTDKVRLICVMTAFHNNIYLGPLSEAWLDEYWPRLAPRYNWHLSIYGTREQWRIQADTQATGFLQPDRNTIRLIPKPEETATGALTVNMAVRPVRTSDEVADNVYDDWAEVVAEGALSTLKGMTGQAWSDPAMAAVHDAKFKDGIAEARGDQVRSHARDDQTVGRVRAYD